VRHAGPLTQFQEKGGSLLEETAGATQTQAPPAGTPPAAQANTMSLVRCGRMNMRALVSRAAGVQCCMSAGNGHAMDKTLAHSWLVSMASPCLA